MFKQKRLVQNYYYRDMYVSNLSNVTKYIYIYICMQELNSYQVRKKETKFLLRYQSW